MDPVQVWLFVVGLVVGFVVSGFTRGRRPPTPPVPPAPPTIAGQPAGDFVAIDFEKRYDLVIHPRGDHERVLRRCRILGLTGEDVRRVESWKFPKLHGWMDRWLALQTEDGRAFYLPTSDVQSVEESPAM